MRSNLLWIRLFFSPKTDKSFFCMFSFLHRDLTKVTFMWEGRCFQKVMIQQYIFQYLMTCHQNSMEAKVRCDFRRKVGVLYMEQTNLSNSESFEHCYVPKLYFNIFVVWLHLRWCQSHILLATSKKATIVFWF